MTEQNTSTGRLLDRQVTAEFLRESTAFVAVKKDLIERGTKSVVVFRIGPEWLALPTNVFQEIGDRCAIRRLPDRRGGILSGLVNIRGELLLCVALGTLLGLEPSLERTETERKMLRPHLLVCNRKGDRLAFSVAEIFGIHRYNPEDLRDVPATLAKAAAGAWTVGMLPWNGRTVGCLNDELVFYALNKGLA